MNRNVNVFNEKFPEPTTLRECYERMFQLKTDISKIRNQLLDNNRMDRLNMNDNEYDNWRHKATSAKNAKITQLHSLDNWGKSQKTKEAIDAMHGENHVAVIGKLVDLINDIRQKHHVPLSGPDVSLVSMADSIVNDFPVGR